MSMTLLKQAAKRYGQRGAARKLWLSAATVNRVLHGAYPNPEHVLAKAAEVFGEPDRGDRCPVLGEIHPDVCARYAAWAAEGRVHRDRMYRQVKNTCISCSKRKNDEEESDTGNGRQYR